MGTDFYNIQFCEILTEKAKIQPFTMVIFGGTGDLSRRKLLPTLYHLCKDQHLPEEFSIIGFASSPRSDDEYREFVKRAIEENSEEAIDWGCWENFSRHIFYLSGGFEDEDSYRRLSLRLEEITKTTDKGTREIIYYMAVPQQSMPGIIDRLSICKLCKGVFSTRLIVEKPFGSDRASAIELNRLIGRAFDENQIYRIDHYLGKETVQNIMFFRFANSIFEPLWNRRYIDHVQITVAEAIGIENRARFYEKAGVIRDIVQNHMMQILSLVAMEPPIGFEADYIRDEKAKVYRTVRQMDNEYIDRFTVRGQYGGGVIHRQKVPAYHEEKDVARDSNTPTYFAGKFHIDNWRWAGVPFYLRTGKRLKKRITEISIHFKQPPLKLFSAVCEISEPNVLVLGVQPHEKITLNFGVKHPGIGNQLYPVSMDFNYERDFQGNVHFPLPYERLLIDCMKGDQTLFARQDGVEAMWAVVDPIIRRWEETPAPEFPNYSAGSWGPEKADDLLRSEGRQWRIW
ncbi:MAG: glucose-6-phosphate dehydrogenase [Nitrospirae bacterium]|nr:glucose-6-phosphate dehydrogenase [Nitrospirota bacterium]